MDTRQSGERDLRAGGPETGADATVRLLRRGLLGLAALTAAGLVLELAAERHWTQPLQLLAWLAIAATLFATALLVGAPTGGRVRAARWLAGLVIALAGLGIYTHIAGNHEAGVLDFRYAETWATLAPPVRWWLALTKTVGPAPPFAPGALAEAALAVLLASIGLPRTTAR